MRPPTAESFWTQLSQDIERAKYESSGRRLNVVSVTSGLVRLVDVRGEPAGVAAYAGVVKLYPGDEVWVEPVGNLHVDRKSLASLQQWIVIGKITRTSPGVIQLGGTELVLTGSMDIAGATDDGATKTWSIDGATGSAVFGSVNTPIIELLSQGSSDTGTVTSTVTYQTACSQDVVLPPGTWRIKADGLLACKHSANTGVNMLVQIDGTDGAAKTLDCPSGSFRMLSDNGELSGVAGSRTIQVKIRYKPSDAGTATGSNPRLLTIATRTS